jgi:uncharacterized protein (TIGR02466 family)
MTDPALQTLFVTRLYRAEWPERGGLVQRLDSACRSIAEDDEAGQRWAEEHGYHGYTSYASLDDLPTRFPEFRELAKGLDAHVARFAEAVGFELGTRKLILDALWINVLWSGGVHTGHIHPNSAVSGTFYVAIPEGTSGLKLEDPRLPLMMAAPPRRTDAPPEQRPFVVVEPRAGTLLLWESWLRHEVPQNQSDEERISVSFNYRWG